MSMTIQSKADRQTPKKGFVFFRSIKPKEMIFFLTQLSMMLDVGISLTRAIESIQSQVTNLYFKGIMEAMVRDIEEGYQLSAAMRRHPKAFKPVYVNMIKSGETGGFLIKVIDGIIQLLEKKQEIKSRIQTALAYPLVLCCMAFLVTLFVLIGILPKFMVFFEGKYNILPVTTRVMMGLSFFLQSYWWICILICIALAAGITLYLSSQAAGRHLDWLAINIIVLSKLSNTIFTGIFLRTLGNMLESGVPLSDAITIAGNTIENSYYREYVENIRTTIEQGSSFSTGFAANRHIHESVKQMISVGENVGKLAPVMLKLAHLFEIETEQNLKRLTSLIEPVALIFMGFVVWVIVSSVVLPMFRLAGAMR